LRHSVVDVQPLAWPLVRLAEVVDWLGQRETGGTAPRRGRIPTPLPVLAQADDETFARWLAGLAWPWALEVEPVYASYGEMGQVVRRLGPLLVRLPEPDNAGEPRFLVTLRRRGWWLMVLGPDGVLHRVAPEVVREAWGAAVEAPHLAALAQCLERAGVPAARQTRARRALLEAELASTRLGGCWRVRFSPSASLWSQARHARIPGALGSLLAGYSGHLALTLLAWWLLSQSTLTGALAWGWLGGWIALLGTAVALQGLATIAQNQISIGLGSIFKQRLLYGALHLTPEDIRHQGAGHFLSQVMESEAVELLALGGGWLTVLALVQLSVAAGIVTLGAVGWPHALLLLGWILGALALGWGHWHRSQTWMTTYREMTQTLVEQMVGHRTRLAQEDRAHWHDDDDQQLERYMRQSTQVDRLSIALTALIPRGWSVVGLGMICYGMLVRPSGVAPVAISLGGLLLALQALTRLVNGTQSLVGALLAWQQVGPLWQAARRGRDPAVPAGDMLAASAPPAETGQPVLTARELSFRYRPQGHEVLRECNLQIRRGERLLLEGPSGGGKSTLAALLAGARTPASGILLLWGYDQPTLGAAAWRQRVVVVPQFHENHVLSATLAFNLLMGRGWPPQPADLAAAEAVCRALGLGDVLDRMPSGMQQMVGEHGWQLSHGERSRLYIARALLQHADLLILDESFGALDPENLQRTLRYVLQRAPTLLVIAHP